MSALIVGINFIGTIILVLISFIIARNIGIKLSSSHNDVIVLAISSIIFISLAFVGIYFFSIISLRTEALFN
jgi:hypothetical protein